jgi:streptogramin lyase
MPLIIRDTIASPGRGPAGLAWDGELLWNADFKEGMIFGYDPLTKQTRRQLLCHGNLGGLAWDGQSLWQSLYDEAMVRRLNPATNDFDQHIILTDFGWLSGLAWDGQSLWVTAQQKGQLLALDPESEVISRTFPVPIACGDIHYRSGRIWASIATPMAFNQKIGQFETTAGQLEFAIITIDASDGRELGRYPTDRFYTGLCWVNDELWLAHSGDRVLIRCSVV